MAENCDCFIVGCRQPPPSKLKCVDMNDTLTPDGVDSLFEGYDTDNLKDLSLAEYLVWVRESRGDAVVHNSTIVAMYIDNFERYVARAQPIPTLVSVLA